MTTRKNKRHDCGRKTAAAATRRRRRVLVVDDTPANVRLLSGILKVAGYEVVMASSGPEALDALPAADPDVVC
jgi:CheY-like chemotaxis protein